MLQEVVFGRGHVVEVAVRQVQFLEMLGVHALVSVVVVVQVTHPAIFQIHASGGRCRHSLFLRTILVEHRLALFVDDLFRQTHLLQVLELELLNDFPSSFRLNGCLASGDFMTIVAVDTAVAHLLTTALVTSLHRSSLDLLEVAILVSHEVHGAVVVAATSGRAAGHLLLARALDVVNHHEAVVLLVVVFECKVLVLLAILVLVRTVPRASEIGHVGAKVFVLIEVCEDAFQTFELLGK
mmetsp:Transcript_37888/g.55826  ORF Transcript_37888/g.55826 Transcript_37888/m.55826 type:complete len:239 (-) Transcript_37888:113-829(-)